MKKILLYIATAIIVVFCGVSIYYVVRNDENIYSTLSEDKTIYMNIEEEIDIPVVHERPNKKTTIDITSNSEIIEIDKENWIFKAKGAGTAMLTITPSNTKFGPFDVVIYVGNGSFDCPYYVRNESDLSQIGQEGRSLSACYQMVDDIALTTPFTPIGSFSGIFDGNGHTIQGLTMNTEVADQEKPAGLFSVIEENGKVENLTIKDAVIDVKSRFSGIIAGRNYGLIGKCSVINGKISNKIPEEYLATGGDSYTGLICGLNESKNSYAQVNLCTAKGSITSDYIAGGLVGLNKAGMLINNKIELEKVQMAPAPVNEEKYLFGGIAGRTSNSTGVNTYSVVVNNLVVIENITADESKVGGIFGLSYTNNTKSKGYYSMLIYNAIQTFKSVSKNVNDFELSSKSTTARNYTANITRLELNQAKTYTSKTGSNWDIKNIWSVEENKSVSINYLNEDIDYQEMTTVGEVFEISDLKTLKLALDNMRVYPTANVVYKILGESTSEEIKDENGEPLLDEEGNPVIEVKEKTYTYNLKGANWEPIGSKTNPFQGTIIAEKDATITIKNFSTTGEYTGLFGYLGENANINNVIVDSAKISGTVAGGITGFNNGGKISNCKVLNSKIVTTKYAGPIAGFNNGTIEGTSAMQNKIIVNKEVEKNIYLAGIAGKSKGNILNCVVDEINIEVTFESEENTVCLGGIAGFIENAKIENSSVSGMSASTYKYMGRTYAGGIAGYVLNSSILSSGVSTSGQVKLNTYKTTSIAGGIAGYLSTDGIVKKSAVATIILISNSSAGIVSFNMGNIEQCYASTNTIVEGKYTGGMTCHLYGTIKDSYSLAQLNGSEVEAGMTTYLWKDSKIEHCFTYCSYSGNGAAYAETYSNYKARKDLFGSIENSIIVGCMNQELAKPTVSDFYEKYIICRDKQVRVKAQIEFFPLFEKFNYVSENALIGQEDSYDLFNKLGFDKNIWSFGDETKGISPKLVEVFDLGEIAFAEITEPEEENVELPAEDVA